MVSNYILTVAGSKGGVGKTTTSINLGACFANAGYSSVIVEADLPMANLVDFIDIDMSITEDETLHDVLAGETRVVDAVYEVDDNLAVVPSGTNPDRYNDIDVDHLESTVEHLWWHYDIIIIDTPAGVSNEVTKPIELADEAILVSTPRVSSVRNTRNTKAIVERIGTDIRGLVLSKSGTGKSPGAERIADFLDLYLLGHVPEDDAVPHSQDHGQPVVEYAPASGPAIAYNRIASELLDTTDISADRPPQPERAADNTPTERGPDVGVAESPAVTASSPEETIHRDDDDGSIDTGSTPANGVGVTAEEVIDSEADGEAGIGSEPEADADASERNPEPSGGDGPPDAGVSEGATGAHARDREPAGRGDRQDEMGGQAGGGSETDPESEGDTGSERTDDATGEDTEQSLVARFRSVVRL